MGLFQGNNRKSKQTKLDDDQGRFFDEVFREELRNHGRWYFEKVINENGELFQEDLKATITEVRGELKEHVTKQLEVALQDMSRELKEHVGKQLDEQLLAYKRTMQDAQDQALASITSNTKEIEGKYRDFSAIMQQKVAEQESAFMDVFRDNMQQIVKMKDAQGMALQSLNDATQKIQEQQKALTTTLQDNIAKQEEVFIDVFKQNMTKIIEHYLLGAIGEQYDLKAQLPTIIQQMETNKQAIVDDIKL